MSNRYSRTGFTKRQMDKLSQIESVLLDMIADRNYKQDSRRALSELYSAQASISQARYLSKQWKDHGLDR